MIAGWGGFEATLASDRGADGQVWWIYRTLTAKAWDPKTNGKVLKKKKKKHIRDICGLNSAQWGSYAVF